MEGSSRLRARVCGGEGEKGAAYKEAGCPVPIGNRLAAEPMGLAQNWQRRSTVPSGRLGGSRANTLTGKERIHGSREWFIRARVKENRTILDKVCQCLYISVVFGYRLMFAMSKQVESHANGLQRWLIGETCLGGRSSSQVSLSEVGFRSLGPQAMTGRVRRQGLGPRSAGRTCASSNCGVCVRERHRVDSRGDLPSSSLGARFFF